MLFYDGVARFHSPIVGIDFGATSGIRPHFLATEGHTPTGERALPIENSWTVVCEGCHTSLTIDGVMIFSLGNIKNLNLFSVIL